MTVHRQLPSEVEPDGLGELIADCMALPELALPHPRQRRVTRADYRDITIPDQTVSLLGDYADYGA